MAGNRQRGFTRPSSGELIRPMITLNQLLANLTSANEPQAEAAAVQLVQFGHHAFNALEKLTLSPEPDIRWWAIRALNEFIDPDTRPIFIRALEDPHPEIQACAALCLKNHPSPEAVPTLIALLGHSDQLLSRLAGGALIALKTEATQSLIDCIESPETTNPRTRLEAVRALAEIQDPTSISTLFKIYQEGSSMMQHWAEEGLTKLGIGMVFFDPN